MQWPLVKALTRSSRIYRVDWFKFLLKINLGNSNIIINFQRKRNQTITIKLSLLGRQPPVSDWSQSLGGSAHTSDWGAVENDADGVVVE